MHRTILLSVFCAAGLVTTAQAQAPSGKALRFWNLTTETITELKLAEPGTNKWGKNQTLNDKDKTVEADERLRLSDVTPGTWDVSVKDQKGRRCTFHNITLSGTEAYAFSIDENAMKACGKK